MPLCFGASRSVRGEQQAPVAVVRARRPHLLPVQHPLLAVAHRTRAQAREVGAGARLGEQLAPHVLAAQHRVEEALLLLVGAPGHDRGAGHRDADREHAGRDVEARLLLVEDPLLPARTAAPAELLRPRDARPARVVERALPLLARPHVRGVGLGARVVRGVEVLRVGPRLPPLRPGLQPRRAPPRERPALLRSPRNPCGAGRRPTCLRIVIACLGQTRAASSHRDFSSSGGSSWST